MQIRYLLCVIFSFATLRAQAAELLTNTAHFSDAPKWVTMTRVNRIAASVQRILEWDVRRVEVIWYHDQSSFEQAHGMGPLALAVTRKEENKIMLGPKVVDKNFDAVFGHELVHVISYQKYKEAIPKWLEEGLANYIAKDGTVDYQWLASKPFPADVKTLSHPMAGSAEDIRYNYVASQALAEMIASKCDFRNLLRLSVGKDMESYFETFCRMKDINGAFQKWVESHAGSKKT